MKHMQTDEKVDERRDDNKLFVDHRFRIRARDISRINFTAPVRSFVSRVCLGRVFTIFFFFPLTRVAHIHAQSVFFHRIADLRYKSVLIEPRVSDAQKGPFEFSL